MSTRGTATTSTGASRSNTPSAARRARCAARAGSCRTRPSSRSSASTSPPLDAILVAEDYRPRNALTILERTQEAYGHLPVAALQHIAHQTGAWYSELYGIATSYPHLRFEPPTTHVVRVCRCTQCTLLGGGRVLEAFREHLGTDVGGISPDGAVRLDTTDCGGESSGSGRVEVDGRVLPRSSVADAITIAAALRADVAQGRPA